MEYSVEMRAAIDYIEAHLYSCVLDVPAETEIINIGILLSGRGHVWMDNASACLHFGSMPTRRWGDIWNSVRTGLKAKVSIIRTL